jgi:hypothetical protein
MNFQYIRWIRFVGAKRREHGMISRCIIESSLSAVPPSIIEGR